MKKFIKEADPKDRSEFEKSTRGMSGDIKSKMERGETPLSKSPAFPDIKSPEVPVSFEEKIASKRFNDVVEKVKRYTGQEDVRSQNALMGLQMAMMGAVRDVIGIQTRNKEYLENLAVDLVRKEMGVRPDQVNYDAKLVMPGQIDMAGFSKQGEEPEQQDLEQNFGQQEEDIEDFMTAFERFDIEKAKRRFINALIQGSSKKGHYMFELVRDELDRIDENLLNLYGVLMSVNDLMYWVLPDQAFDMMMNQGGIAGKEEVDIETDPPTVKARGVFFPVLVHELIKGTMEILGTQGLPDDPKQAEMVMASTDTLANEIWDLRLGPVLWEKFIEAYPERLFDEDKRWIQNYLFARFSALSSEEFFKLAKAILKGDVNATKILDRMIDEIVQHLNQVHDDEDYSDDDEDTTEPSSDDDDDNLDDLDDFLGSLGISRS